MEVPEGIDTAMTYSLYLALALATAGRDDPEGASEATQDLPEVLDPVLGRVRDLVERLRQAPLSPLVAAQFEKDLQQLTRELAQIVAQWTYNHLDLKQAKARGPVGPASQGSPVGNHPPRPIASGLFGPDCDSLMAHHTSCTVALGAVADRGLHTPTSVDLTLNNAAHPPGGRRSAGVGSNPTADTPTSCPSAAPGTADARRHSRRS